MKLTTLPVGAKGFDANTIIPLSTAQRFTQAGFSFVARYVRRSTANPYDITSSEFDALTASGLAVMLVQHVAQPGWLASPALGKAYGGNAADHAHAVGYLPGAHLWCDLEGVGRAASPDDVTGYCNAWYDAVSAAGFVPGLYVGDSCGLTAQQLYHTLKFTAYWGAYNLNRDNEPAVRGLMLKQHPYPPPGQRVPCGFQYDTDEIRVDAMGGTPILVSA